MVGKYTEKLRGMADEGKDRKGGQANMRIAMKWGI